MATTSGDSSEDFASQLLLTLSKTDPIISAEAFPKTPYIEVKAALDRLSSRSMVTYETIERDEALLEPEGLQIAENGSHEARVFETLRKAVEGLTVQELEKAIGDKNVAKLGQGKAFKEKWISKTKDGKFKASVSDLDIPQEAGLC
jgi:phenylalanyl-tRNA synthetase alpha chain